MVVSQDVSFTVSPNLALFISNPSHFDLHQFLQGLTSILIKKNHFNINTLSTLRSNTLSPLIPHHQISILQSLIPPSRMAQFDSEWEQLLKSSQPKNFSDATVFDILTRLPVKSILRFMTVCKKWYTLSGDSQFIEAHLNRSDWHYLVRQYPYEEEITDICNAVFSLMREEHFQHLCELHFKPEPFCEYDIVASADGILCIVKINYRLSDLDILLWNPATRELKILPKFIPDQRHSGTCFGFGAKTNDYKVVVILQCKDSFEVNVYSLRTDSWKVVQVDSSYRFHQERRPTVYVNGRVHWFGSVGSHELIVSYDVAEEKFIGMDIPEFEYPKDHVRALCESPASLGKSVILCEFLFEAESQTWFMKEHGDSKSWAKLYCFLPHLIYGCPEPCIFLDNGKIMMLGDENMLLCDPKDQLYEVPNVHNVVKYQESLVSIKEGGCIGDLNHCA